MVWICFTLLLLRNLCLTDLDLGPWLSSPLHQACVNWTQSYSLSPVFAGLVCGAPLQPEDRKLFLNLGVYHWLVASGGHLIFLQSLLQKMISSKAVIVSLLIGYALVCGLQPPIARSLVGLGLALMSERFSFFTSRSQLIVSTGALTLFIFPQWYTSFSFQLSWLAALALSAEKSIFRQSLLISVVLFPLSQTWSLLHLIYNLILTPLFAGFLFPMSLLFFVIAPFTLLGNFIWDCFFIFARHLPSEANPFLFEFSTFTIWCYIFCLQTIQWLLERTCKSADDTYVS